MSVKERGRIQPRLMETEETGQQNAMCVCVCMYLMKKLLSNGSEKSLKLYFQCFYKFVVISNFKRKEKQMMYACGGFILVFGKTNTIM